MSERDEVVLEAIAGRRVPPGGRIRANCPWCPERVGTEDVRQCMSVDVETGSWWCWRCHAAGLLQAERIEEAGISAPAVKRRDRKAETMALPEGFWELFAGPGAEARSLRWARAYLGRRGILEETSKAVGVGACARGRCADRVVVPIRTAGELVGWSARLVGGDDPTMPKYLYPSGMDRQHVMFNADAIGRSSTVPLIVVEGVFDALPLWPDAVALLGKPSDGQVDQLRRARRPVVVALDGDAWREGKALAMRLRKVGAVALRLPPKADPGSTPPDELRAAAAAAAQGLGA